MTRARTSAKSWLNAGRSRGTAMRTNNKALFLLGAVSVAGAISLPGTLSAFNLLSPPVSLGVSASGTGYQRDVRVYNNSNQNPANVDSDQTPEANHPGVLGAALTIWHASDAWASQT